MAQYYDKKTCITCKIEKEITSFNIRKDSKDGYRNQCKVCTTTQKNIDKIMSIDHKKQTCKISAAQPSALKLGNDFPSNLFFGTLSLNKKQICFATSNPLEIDLMSSQKPIFVLDNNFNNDYSFFFVPSVSFVTAAWLTAVATLPATIK